MDRVGIVVCAAGMCALTYGLTFSIPLILLGLVIAVAGRFI